jgi:glycerophosphoryl diester phosphodiesterase
MLHALRKDLAALRDAVVVSLTPRFEALEEKLGTLSAEVGTRADMVELDVLLSKDRKMVVIHDESLDRTTNGKGMVRDYTLSELKTFDAGSWLDARFRGERLPTLEEVLDMVNGRVAINMEIKRSAYEPNHPPDAIEKQVVELVTRKNALDNVLISSFEWRVLEKLSVLKKAPAIALLSQYPELGNPLEACKRLEAISWHPSSLLLKKDHVRRMHEAGILVFPWKVDTREDIERMLEMDVDGLIVDDPLLVKAFS